MLFLLMLAYVVTVIVLAVRSHGRGHDSSAGARGAVAAGWARPGQGQAGRTGR